MDVLSVVGMLISYFPTIAASKTKDPKKDIAIFDIDANVNTVGG